MATFLDPTIFAEIFRPSIQAFIRLLGSNFCKDWWNSW